MDAVNEDNHMKGEMKEIKIEVTPSPQGQTSEEKAILERNTVHPESVNVKVAQSEKEVNNEESHCCAMFWFTLGEILVYPLLTFFMAMFINLGIGIVLLLIGALGLISIAFFPFYLICCICKGCRGCAAGGLQSILFSIIILLVGIVILVIFPFIAMAAFVQCIIKICKQDISWNKTVGENMSVICGHSTAVFSKVSQTVAEQRAKSAASA